MIYHAKNNYLKMSGSFIFIFKNVQKIFMVTNILKTYIFSMSMVTKYIILDSLKDFKKMDIFKNVQK
jgi:hypothetical protein